MELDRSGIILYTIEYTACVHFYKNVLGLKIMFRTESLTCFEFGASYLMVEIDDEYSEEISHARDRTCLRMNVPNVKAFAEALRTKEIAVDYQEHEWGTIAKFRDPDGNLCAFKDSPGFERQISDFQNDN